MAVIIAMTMVFVGYTAVMADATDAAEPVPLNTVTVEEDGTDASNIIKISEGYYVYYGYELTWTISVGTCVDVTIGTLTKNVADDSASGTLSKMYIADNTASKEDATDENFTLELVRDSDNVGFYTVKITGVKMTSGIDYTLKASMKVWIDDGAKDTMYESFPNFAVYNGNVVVGVGSGAVNIKDFTGFQIGAYKDALVAFEDVNKLNVEDYDWYAVGLPKGLVMSSNGHISGIPTEKLGEDEKVKVYATDKVTGAVIYDDEVGIGIDDAPVVADKFTYTVTIDSVDEGAGSLYLIKSGTIATVTMKNGETALTTGTKITVISDNGVSTVLDEGTCNLPTTGSGAYTVQMEYSGQIQTFKVCIIGEAADLGANIAIQGGN